jgi:ribosome-associated toxin RatA of RatAB toxin-antitoxin module
MHTSLSQRMHATPEVVFSVAERVEDWPRILPHYRWVNVLEVRPQRRTVEMAARRDAIGTAGFPLRWTSIQWLDPEKLCIDFEHIAGITRGMRVRWSIVADPAEAGWTIATIAHEFTPGWPVPETILQAIVGEYFVNGVARRTLRTFASIVETRSVPAANSSVSVRA